MARDWQPGDPIQGEATCDPICTAQWMTFGHHQVMVADVWSILITYPWMLLETRNEPWVATLIFNPAPKHLHTAAQVSSAIRKHPIAPPPPI